MGEYEKIKGSGVWYISYCDRQGKRHRERVGRRADAITAYHDRKREIREGRYVPPRSGGRALTFRDLAERAMEDKKLRNRPRSIVADAGHLKIIYPFLGNIRADEVSPSMLQEMFKKLVQERKLSGSSGNSYRAVVSSMYTYGVRMGYVLRNPISNTRPFKKNDDRIRWLRPEEEERLRKVIREKCPEREAEFDLALYTGMRRGEQFTLKWADVDLELGQLVAFGKMGRRIITLSAKVKAALEVLRSKRPADAIYVCPETKSDEQCDWRRWFEEVVKEAGITDFRYHDIRHTFASRLVMAGVHLLTVKELLGHRSIVMTERYSHLAAHHRHAAVEKIYAYKFRFLLRC